MKSKFYIQCRLDDTMYDWAPKNEYQEMDFYEIRRFLFWIFNNGNYRTEAEMKRQLKNLEEECLAIKQPNPVNMRVMNKKMAMLRDFIAD